MTTYISDVITKYPSLITILMFAVTALIGWGVYKNIIARLLVDVEKHTKELGELKKWGEVEIAKQVQYREDHFVSLDRFTECVQDIKRRLDEVNTLDMSSRLARIEAILDQIQITLKDK